ncbi:phosphatase PAP2 family protein [Actinoplanes sp. NPDC020271]|uniref:phosphatase PAP2 family protein n=1 Tax=Actinoplanes sp. NPDC020271 TaxID=3363896 RepID=UPI0037A11F60
MIDDVLRSRPNLIAFSIGCPAAAFVLLAVAVAAKATPLLSFDARISDAAHALALAHPLWRSIMAAVTVTGSFTVIGPLAVAGCAILLATGRWRQAAFGALALTVTPLLRLVVLTLIARPRPADQLAAAASYSFPSGHTTASATAALVLMMIGRPMLRTRRGRVLLTVATTAWAVLVGVSRVALVVHWPSDVVGAWLFSVTIVLAIAMLTRRLFGPARSAEEPDPPVDC